MAPFEPCVLIPGVRDRIEAIASHGDRLYLGSSTGTLHVYSVTRNADSGSFSASLLQSKKSFTRRSIEQLGFIKDVNSLVLLSDSTVTIHTAPRLTPPTALTQARGAMCFAIDTSVETPPLLPTSASSDRQPAINPIPTVITRLAVGCKRKIVVYTWKDGEAQEVLETVLPHSPRAVAFSTSNAVILAYPANEYVILSLDTMSATEITLPSASTISTGLGALGGFGGYMTLGLVAKVKPSVVKVGDGEAIITKDNSSVFIGSDAAISRPSNVVWPGSPDETTFVKPYILAILPPGAISTPDNLSSSQSQQPTSTSTSTIQIRSAISLAVVQTLALPLPNDDSSSTSSSPSANALPIHTLRVLSPSSIAKSPVFLVSTPNDRALANSEGSTIWLLAMQPWGQQIDELVEAGAYADALALLDTLDETVLNDKDQRVSHIRGLHAVSLFGEGEYGRAADIFIELEVNPAKVIALYPNAISGRLNVPRERWIELFGGKAAKAGGDMDKEKEGGADGEGSAKEVEGNGSGSGSGNGAGGQREGVRSPSPLKPNNTGGRDDDTASIRGGSGPEPELRRAVETLLRYLSDRRQKVSGALAALHISTSKSADIPFLSETSVADLFALPDSPPSALIPEQLLRFAQIVDTALFKSYLVVRPALLGSLCRLDNWCEVSEVEEILRERKKYTELIDLYRGKKMHDKALSLLREQSADEDDPAEKVGDSIRYLQKLGPDYLELIFDSALWIFETDAGRALEIFKSEEVQLPRWAVANYLEKIDSALCARYIEYLIGEHDETDPMFHDRLAELYLEAALKATAKHDDAARGVAYKKLLAFIDSSEHFRTDRLFGRLPQDDLFEARAILLGRLGKHEGTLEIYVHRLQDYAQAEEYCKRVYQSSPEHHDIFLTLLRIYLRPTSKQSTVLLPAALDLISRQSPRLNSIETLELLPPLVTASDVKAFLCEALRTQKIEAGVMKEMWKARKDQVDQRLMSLHSQRVRVTDSRICPQCHKRLGNSVIAVHAPRGEVTHYQCRESFAHKLKDTVFRRS